MTTNRRIAIKKMRFNDSELVGIRKRHNCHLRARDSRQKLTTFPNIINFQNAVVLSRLCRQTSPIFIYAIRCGERATE